MVRRKATGHTVTMRTDRRWDGEIVALAVPAAAGIPVTLRFSSTSFTVVTGHEDPARSAGTACVIAR